VSPGRRPKVLFCIWALEAGGAERFLVELAKRVPRDRFDAKVVCLARKGPWAREAESAGIEVLSLDKKTGFDLGIVGRLRRLFRAERPDIVNTHLWTADVWARLAAILEKVPRIVVTEQNVDVWKKAHHRLIDRLLFRRTDKVVCVSDQVKAFYRDHLGVPEAKLEVIPNAISVTPPAPPEGSRPLRDEIGASAEDFVLLCAARLHPQKAHVVLFEAARRLLAEGAPPFRVALAGEGSLRPELEQRARALGLGDRVHFLGFRNDVRALLPQADAFVLPSLYEGLPLSALEAMAAGLPVVVTRVGGNPGIVDDGVNGLMVEPGDPKALAAALGRVLRDRALGRALGEEGRRRVAERHDIERVAARTYSLFDELLGHRP
jgi:glycosyltransferase involved in cell wall biosynthesis